MGKKKGQTGKFALDLVIIGRFSALAILVVGLAAAVSFAAPLQLAQATSILMIVVTTSLIVHHFGYWVSPQIMLAETEPALGLEDKEFVAGLLNELGENYSVIHDVEGPDGNIDLIVLGRDGGVFLIEANSHPGRVEILDDGLRLNGKSPDEDFIARTLKNSFWLQERLADLACGQVGVTPILVFTNAFVQTSTPVKGVAITNRKYLLNLIYKRNHSDNQATCLWDVKEKFAEIINPPRG
jgi:hypothetical protein